jgi:hypothetical protein
MQRLVECLKKIDESDLPDVPEFEDVYLSHDDHELVREIEGLANQSFIDEGGHPRFEDMDKLWHEYGYFIFPGERDRFGWLTACIQTKKGIIVFG